MVLLLFFCVQVRCGELRISPQDSAIVLGAVTPA